MSKLLKMRPPVERAVLKELENFKLPSKSIFVIQPISHIKNAHFGEVERFLLGV